MKPVSASVLIGSSLALCLVGAACATKRQVREYIAPVQNQINQTQNRVNDLRGQIDRNHEGIGDLDRRLAIAGQTAADAQARSARALETARQATNLASEATRRASSATATAQQVQGELIRTNRRIDAVFNRLEGYRLTFEEQIFFPFGQSELPTDEASKLEQAIRRLQGIKNYIIEVEGFADSSGNIGFNRQLSRKRADSVVHYLVVEHRVPLRFVWKFGAGADFPNADNQTPTARRQNRRVDVRIYSLSPERPAADGAASKP